MSSPGADRRSGRLLNFLPVSVTQLVQNGAGAGSALTQTAAVLSADISGFTALADELAERSSTGGAEALQRRLNQVIAPTVAQLISGGGDVMGFAGDSVLALFVAADGSDPDRCLAAAVGAAEAGIIQARSVGLGLRVGITVGPVTVALFGDEGRAHVACLGDTVVDAVQGQRAAPVGQVHVRPARPGPRESSVVRSAMPALPAAAFLPAGRGDQVRAGRSLLLSERRPVTSVFAALPASLARPERRDHLQLEIVSALAVVRTQGGDLRQVEITPDGPVLVCTFGAMWAGVDDEARAVACARDLIDAGAAQAVGVATGPVFCGELGTAHRRDLAVVGGSVNLAARLMGAAASREILIDETTQKGIAPAGVRAGGSTAVRALVKSAPRQLSVRGLVRPVRAWRVGSALSEDDRDFALRSTPLVGREAELELLLEAADGIAASRGPAADHRAPEGLTVQAVDSDVRAAHGCVYVVRGPAGIGKSALAAAVVGARSDHVGLTVRFSARETGWAPWGPCLRAMFGLPATDTTTAAETAVETVAAAVSRLGVPRVDGQIDLLGPVLGLAVHGGGRGLARPFDGRGRDELLASFLGEIVQAFARRHRAVLVIEEAHLAGPELDAVLRALLPPVTGALVLVLDRVDGGAPAVARTGQVVDLAPLSSDAARALARAHLSPGSDVLVERVVEFGSGNPLQLEQLALHLADDADGGETEVDDTPRGLTRVLRARLDRLPALARDVTTIASVVEDDIHADLLAAAYPALGAAGAVRAELDRLVELSVLVASGPGRYRFHHAMVRTVAYSGIGLRARQDLHAAVARHLARAIRGSTVGTASRDGARPATPLPELELVAWHFLHSRDTQAKRRWLDLAGRSARDAWSLTTAHRWYTALIPLIGEPERTSATLALAEVQFMTGDWTEARAGYDEVIRHADLGTEAHAAAAHGLGVLALRTSSIPVAIDLLTDAVGTWSDLDRPDRLLASLDRLTFAHHVAGTAEPALAAARRLLAVAVAEAVGEPGAWAEALETAALAAWTAGDLDTAVDRLTAALRLARSVGNLRCVVHGLSDLAGVRLDQGDDDAALAGLTEADAVAERIGYRRAQVSLRANRGEVLRRRGDLDAARDQLVSALASVLVLGDTYVATSVVGNLGLVEAAAGRRTSARRILTSAVAAAIAGGQDAFRREFATALAELDAGEAGGTADGSGDEVKALLSRLDGLISSMDRAL